MIMSNYDFQEKMIRHWLKLIIVTLIMIALCQFAANGQSRVYQDPFSSAMQTRTKERYVTGSAQREQLAFSLGCVTNGIDSAIYLVAHVDLVKDLACVNETSRIYLLLSNGYIVMGRSTTNWGCMDRNSPGGYFSGIFPFVISRVDRRELMSNEISTVLVVFTDQELTFYLSKKGQGFFRSAWTDLALIRSFSSD